MTDLPEAAFDDTDPAAESQTDAESEAEQETPANAPLSAEHVRMAEALLFASRRVCPMVRTSPRCWTS
jgi:hypothetical protein